LSLITFYPAHFTLSAATAVTTLKKIGTISNNSRHPYATAGVGLFDFLRGYGNDPGNFSEWLFGSDLSPQNGGLLTRRIPGIIPPVNRLASSPDDFDGGAP
jgi:hypothetical protein